MFNGIWKKKDWTQDLLEKKIFVKLTIFEENTVINKQFLYPKEKEQNICSTPPKNLIYNESPAICTF